MDPLFNLADKFRQDQGSQLAKTVLTREIDGVKLSLQVSPCSWLYKGYGLQVQVIMAGGGDAYVFDKKTKFEDASMQNLEQMFETVKVCKCSKCGGPAFDPESVDTNRGGVCETCFMAKLNEEFAKIDAAQKKEVAALDAKRKREGHTHRIDAWVHPEAGGDDYPISFYSKGEPLKQVIQAALKKEGSAILDEYSVFVL